MKLFDRFGKSSRSLPAHGRQFNMPPFPKDCLSTEFRPGLGSFRVLTNHLRASSLSVLGYRHASEIRCGARGERATGFIDKQAR